jgi:serine phosphatase RsbU (regulator of sigma subunit)
MEDYQYESCGLVLQPGDCLVMFSDGLTDMLSPGGQRFGFPGIREAVQDASGPGTPRIIGELLLQAVMHHASGREAPDDLTMVCFGRVD